MKHILILSSLTISAFPPTSIKDFSNLIGPDSQRKIFNELLTEHPIIVLKCTSTHCPKYKNSASQFNSIAKKHVGKALFIDVNVQKLDEITDTFNLKSVPTFIIFMYGKPYKKIRGSGTLDEVAAHLSLAIKKLN